MGLTITKAMGMGKREPNQISSAGGLVGRVLYGSTYECAAVSRVAWALGLGTRDALYMSFISCTLRV